MKYKQLKEFIEIRRRTEEANPIYPRYALNPTTVNFCNFDGKTLLHLAAEEGLLDEIKNLLAEGANINLRMVSAYENSAEKSSLLLAVEAGQLGVAKYLCEQGADCSELLVASIENPEFVNWFKNFVQDQIKARTDLDINQLLMVQMVQNKPFLFYSSDKKHDAWDGILYAVTYLGDLDYLKKITKFLDDRLDKIGSELLNIAIAQGNVKTIEFLLDQGVPIHPKTDYTSTPLHEAIVRNRPEVIAYLLSRGADLTRQNRSKHDALMLAVVQKNLAAFKLLLPLSSIDFERTDVEGNTVFHLAVESGNIEILEQLLTVYPGDIQSRVAKKNIYGQSILDLAVRKNQVNILDAFSAKGINEFPRLKDDGPVIKQRLIIRRMNFYLTLQHRSLEYFPLEGKCGGFSHLHNYYASLGMEDYFFSTLELIANWNGSQEALDRSFEPGSLHAKFYNNLDELFEQWINDVLWFQHSSFTSVLQQKQRFQQHMAINPQPDRAPVCVTQLKLKPIQSEQIAEIITFFKKMPMSTQLELGGSEHATSATLAEGKKIYYYDPNCKYRTHSVTSSDELAKQIVDMKYIRIGKLDGGDLDFYFLSPSNQLNGLKDPNYRVFLEEEYPKNLAEAEKFQQNSPNQFTPLHIAVITRSVNDLKQLLDSQCCDMNAKDCRGETAFELAVRNQFIEGINLLLNYPGIEVPFKQILEDCLRSNQDNADSTEIYSSPLIYQFIVAIKYRQDHLFPQFLATLQRQHINLKENDGFKLLNYAVEYDNADLIKALLESGASWSGATLNKEGVLDYLDSSPMEKVIAEHPKYLPLLLETIDDINKPSVKGNTLVHFAIKNRSVLALDQILANNSNIANLQAKNSQDETPLALLLDSKTGDNEALILKLTEAMLNFPQFDMDTNKHALSELMVLSMNKNWDSLFNFLLSRLSPEILGSKQNGLSVLLIKAMEASRNNTESVKYITSLLDKGVDPGKSERTGSTFFHVIVNNFDKLKDDRYVTELLRHGLDPGIENKEGKTVIDLAKEKAPKILHLFEKQPQEQDVVFQNVFSDPIKEDESLQRTSSLNMRTSKDN